MTIAGLALAAIMSQATAQRTDMLSPGAVVLLASKSDPQAAETVRRALVSPDPLVRRAAARVAAVAQPDAYDALLRALPDEADPVVAAEFITDALALGGKNALPRVEPAAQRLGPAGIVPIAEWFARTQPEAFPAHLPDWMKTPGADDRLVAVVAFAIAQHPQLREPILATWEPVASDGIWKRTKDAITRVVTMRTPAGLEADVLSGTLSATGCRPSRDMVTKALVTYAVSGRPTRIDVNVGGLSNGCRDALTAIARISRDPLNTGGKPQTLVVPMTPRFLACVASPNVEPRFAGNGVSDPRLTKEVKPDYTREAMRNKVQGVEELDVVISSAGCVKSVEVTRSLPGLDLQGLIAVIQWQFEPGRLNGSPVAVVASVELTFTLRR